MIGERLSHYEIVDTLGEGGMGTVYLARDTRLDRDVALKVLRSDLAADAERIERFTREARTLARLEHPNIVIIHSVEEAEGVRFLTMERLRGKTLAALTPRGGMPLKRLFEIAVPVADALAAAHDRNVVHRDLKPGNIMVTGDGRVKVLDFGLAKLRQEAEAIEWSQAATEPLTGAGRIVGTLPYMSPEQLEGAAVDARSDLFSLGVILYELATGRRPFEGDSSAELISSIERDTPRPVDEVRSELPHQLGRIVGRCLEKDPEKRFQTAKDVRNELEALRGEVESSEIVAAARPSAHRGRWWIPAATGLLAATIVLAVVLAVVARRWTAPESVPEATAGAPLSVAVLPFRNPGADRSIDYLRMAVPDEVTTTLARSPALAIRPFSITSEYSPERLDPGAAGRELKASHLVTGQFYREQGELHLTLEALEVAGNRLLWRERVTVGAQDLLALRYQVSERVRRGLLPRLGVPDATVETQPTDPQAYDLFLRSLAVSRDPVPNRRAIAMLEEAVELDPSYAPAWAELSGRHYNSGNYDRRGEEAYRASERAALQALELDPDQVSAIRLLVVLKTERGRTAEAYELVEDLLERRPGSADAHFARSYVLRYAGVLDEAVRECQVARAIDPGDPTFRSCAVTHYLAGRYPQALEFIELDPSSGWGLDNRVTVMLRQGRREEALALLRPVAELPLPYRQHLIGCLEGQPRGQLDELARTVASQTWVDPEQLYWHGAHLAACGEPEFAVEMLRRAVGRGYCIFPAADTDPLMAAAREAPGFAEVRAQGIACRERFLAQRAQGREAG